MDFLEQWWNNTLPEEKIVVIGAGSLGKLTVDCILRNNQYPLKNISILDDNPEVLGKSILGIPVIGTIDDANKLSKREGTTFVIAIANNDIRKKIVEENPALEYKSVISREAVVSPYAKIGRGTIILPGVVVDPDATIGENVIINKLVTIAHDVILHDFSQVSPGVNLGGFVELGECSFIGLGATVLPSVVITNKVTIGAGAVVTKDIKINSSVYVGNPAKLLKQK